MYSLKKLKRPFVFVPMAADLFHHGHINILLKAKKYGTVIVGLMTDNGIKSYKKRSPLINFKNRMKILQQIKCIDKVIPLNGLKYVEYANPNSDPTNAVYIHKRSLAILSIISHIVFPLVILCVFMLK